MTFDVRATKQNKKSSSKCFYWRKCFKVWILWSIWDVICALSYLILMISYLSLERFIYVVIKLYKGLIHVLT